MVSLCAALSELVYFRETEFNVMTASENITRPNIAKNLFAFLYLRA
jgi:hypothetical protein